MSDEQLSRQIADMARARGLDASPDLVAEAVKRVLASLGGGLGQAGKTDAASG